MKTFSFYLLFTVLLKQTSSQRRIVGGSDAEDGMFPYATFLLIDNVASCTGSILTHSWVLTAAHCVDGRPSNVKIVAGVADKTSNEAQVRYSTEVEIHPKYMRQALAAYDIALVRVTTPFNLSSPNIGTISLMSEIWPQDNQMNVRCKALGWGRISNSGNLPNILQHLDVVARHGSRGCPCVKRFEQKKLVCLEGVAGKGPCMGDSGGPLVCNGKEVGITHMGFTKEKCNPVYPDVPKTRCGQEDTVVAYIYLCPHLNWIRKYVPVVPATPDSCSAPMNCRLHSGLIILTTFYIIATIKMCSYYSLCVGDFKCDIVFTIKVNKLT